MMEKITFFAEQVSISQYLISFFYIFATVGVVIGIFSVICIDAGLVRAKNLITTIVNKVLVAFISAIAFIPFGYGVWNWQYYQAFDVPDPLLSAIRDWGLLGINFSSYSHNIDPKFVGNADMSQIFGAFFFAFSALTAVLIHGAGLERIKSSASYIIAVIIGSLLVPVSAYLTYGSTSPLTNAGLHDFVGAYSLYMIVGVWGLILAWRLGPRKVVTKEPGNFSLLSIGVFLLVIAIPMFVVGCGFIIPGSGYFGPTMTTTGLGFVFNNIFIALGGGGITGGLFAHINKKPSYILLGPISGYISCSAVYDIALPYQILIISMIGPVLLVLGEKLIISLGIDEPKVAPLTILPAVFSALMAGVIGSGVKQGGYLGIVSGPYAFQGSSISFSMQLLGIVIVVSFAAISAFIVIYAVEKTIGLRINEEAEAMGMDSVEWSSGENTNDELRSITQ